ncbi:tRNA-modifying protein YgfZ [Sodalis-like secondary symbiont of Drepanosiphum platanoidis]|uniref:tRNA-modifying protein YgfZ n=1 Tax=Sodalis-like secondary symbiont of Drepanosiphum platanoidis TaxID=2994493 RepID=UPI003464A51C
MSLKNFFSYKLPSISTDLPFTLMLIEDFKIISIDGKDNINFLQNQLTSDIFNIKENEYSFSSYCNYKGKVISVIYLFFYKKKISFIVNKSIYKSLILELKKYSIFYKINFFLHKNIFLLGIAGCESKKNIKKLFPTFSIKNNKKVFYYKKTTFLYFKLPIDRFLIIADIYMKNFFLKKLKDISVKKNGQQWLSLDIESCYPIINKNYSKKFFPQSINLEKLDAISFNKGCYLGQEIISKIKYYKFNKKSLFCLISESNFCLLNKDFIEYKEKKKWIYAGNIISYCLLDNKKILIQAVLKKFISNKFFIRLHKNPHIKLYIFNI